MTKAIKKGLVHAAKESCTEWGCVSFTVSPEIPETSQPTEAEGGVWDDGPGLVASGGFSASHPEPGTSCVCRM